jgi:hypothetical protein
VRPQPAAIIDDDAAGHQFRQPRSNVRITRPVRDIVGVAVGDCPGDRSPAGPALCKAAGLSAATDASGGGAAGSVYMKLNLTNTGSEPCVLRGFAGVSLAADAAGAPIGAPATRDETTAPTDVLLAPGQTGSAVLRYTQAGNYPDCAMVDAAGYRIYPPEDTASLFLPQPTKACSNAEITLLAIGAFQAA